MHQKKERRCFWWWRRRFLGCFHLGTNQFHGVEASSLLLHQKFSTFAQAACCSSCWSYSCSLPFVIRRRVFTRKTDGLVFRESQNTSFWSDYYLRYKSEEKTLESNCNHKEMNVIGSKNQEVLIELYYWISLCYGHIISTFLTKQSSYSGSVKVDEKPLAPVANVRHWFTHSYFSLPHWSKK